METQENKFNPTTTTPVQPEYRTPQSGRIMGGLIIVGVGSLLLARQLGYEIPGWLWSWEVLLIIIGFYVGAKSSFRDAGWVIPVAIGVVFLADDFFYDINITRYFWPVLIIGIGLFMIFRSRKRDGAYFNRFKDGFRGADGSEDVLDSVTIFGGLKKNIISKQFRGGEAVTIFGGTELNLTQADTKDPIVLELVQVFGGTKLIIPPHWKVQTEEMVTIFGGLNDKRPITTPQVSDETRVVVIKGTCIFGGIDIKSF